MADAEELISGLGLVVSGLGLGLTIFFWPRPQHLASALASLFPGLINIPPYIQGLESTWKQGWCLKVLEFELPGP